MPIYKRGNSWLVSVGSLGNRFRQSYKTEREAQIAELEALHRMKALGTPMEPKAVAKTSLKTLKDAHDLTWKLRWSQNKPNGQKTHKVFCKAVFEEIGGNTPVSEIDFQMILDAVEAWEEGGNGGQTVNHKVSHLSVMLDTALDQGWITAKPKLIRRKNGKHRFRWMDEAEELRVLNACQSLGLAELRDFIVVAIDTGFRRGELLNLSPRDLVNGNVILHDGETKTDKGRAVPATERVIDVFQRASNKAKVFTLSVSQLRKQWWDMKTFLDLEDDDQFVIHMLRHTCASRLVQRGVSLMIVKEWLGHSNIQTTMRYAKLAPDSLLEGKRALEQVKPRPQLSVVNG